MDNTCSFLRTTAQIREIDRLAIQAMAGDAFGLMHKAGAAAFARLRANWPEARRILVCCGVGNNGGDGYVLGALALKAGRQVQAVRGAEKEPNTAEARRARALYLEAGGTEILLQDRLPEADLVVDAVFGVGLTEAPREDAARLIEHMNRGHAPILALDLPSGLNADTGAAPGVCVRADATVGFIAWKCGQWTGRGLEKCGQLWLETLEVPSAILRQVPALARLMVAQDRRMTLPRRARDAHKGDFGHALLIGGNHGYGGAIRMAGEASLRGGAGLVSVITKAEHVAALLTACPELMVHAAGEQSDALAPLIARSNAIAIGPGLGQDDWSQALFDTTISQTKPLVLDADALNLLAEKPVRFSGQAVLTPHPGEAARLLEIDVRAVQNDRFAAVGAIASKFNAVVVLKGAGTIVAAPNGEFAVCGQANPGMASGGMGDVLTGVIAAFIAQGMTAWDAARIGVDVHAAAARAAAQRHGERGLRATDVIAHLQAQVNP